VQKDARGLLRGKFGALADRHRAAASAVNKAATATSIALRRLLGRDKEYEAAIKSFVAGSSKEMLQLERPKALRRETLSREMALGVLSGSGIRDFGGSIGGVVGAGGGMRITMTMAKDTQVDVRTPPYDDAWTDTQGGPHHQQQVWATKTDGRFGFLYTIGQEGGSVSCGAGVLILFQQQGSAGQAQIRPYTPYNYVWRNVSYLGTAHQHAGFGVLVWSRPVNGGQPRTDLDHEYWTWNDGTSWYEHHGNLNAPSFDFDRALQFGNQAPYFGIEPGRLYGAWIWCFGVGDAHGADFTSAGYAQAAIDATARWIVIGQQ